MSLNFDKHLEGTFCYIIKLGLNRFFLQVEKIIFKTITFQNFFKMQKNIIFPQSYICNV